MVLAQHTKAFGPLLYRYARPGTFLSILRIRVGVKESCRRFLEAMTTQTVKPAKGHAR